MTKEDVVAADVNYVETEQNPRLSWQNCDITKEKEDLPIFLQTLQIQILGVCKQYTNKS